MKTQLIPLESHDDLISVRDRMSWAKTPRILLVWPKSERIALRPLDLKVLQRHAASLGAQLGLVTRYHNIRREAQAQDIPVFYSTGEAQRSPWPERDLGSKREWHKPRQDLREIQKQVRAREKAWRNYPIVRIGAFMLGVLAVMAIASLFIPRAQIILEAERETQTVSFPVQADPSLSAVFITGSIPWRELRVIVEDNLEMLTTGEVAVPQTKSEGVVTFRNLTEGEVSIPVGTVLTSIGLPGVRFLTIEQGKLPGGLKATVDVPAQAESAGASGNVEAESILAIEGDLGLKVAVTNEEPTSGGRDRMSDAATEADLIRLRNDLLKDLKIEALQEMEAMLVHGDQLFPNTVEAEQILDEAYDPPLGQPSRKVRLNLRVEFKASYASGEDLNDLATTVLNASQPEGFEDTGKTLKFEIRDSYQTNSKGITRWVVRVSRQLEKQVDSGKILSLVKGRNLANAQAQLEDNLGYSPEIQLTPDWWPWLPLIPFNITVETQ